MDLPTHLSTMFFLNVFWSVLMYTGTHPGPHFSTVCYLSLCLQKLSVKALLSLCLEHVDTPESFATMGVLI